VSLATCFWSKGLIFNAAEALQSHTVSADKYTTLRVEILSLFFPCVASHSYSSWYIHQVQVTCLMKQLRSTYALAGIAVLNVFDKILSIGSKKMIKWSRYRCGAVQMVGRGIALLFHDCGTRRGWVSIGSSTTYPIKLPFNNFLKSMACISGGTVIEWSPLRIIIYKKGWNEDYLCKSLGACQILMLRFHWVENYRWYQ